jgi:hypothetical protein
MRYSGIYNSLYERASTEGPNRSSSVSTLVSDILKPSIPLRKRVFHTRYLKTIIDTQRVAQHIDQHTRDNIDKTHTLLHIGSMMMLRKLQRAIVDYLWRPGGPMMYRNLTHALAGFT